MDTTGSQFGFSLVAIAVFSTIQVDVILSAVTAFYRRFVDPNEPPEELGTQVLRRWVLFATIVGGLLLILAPSYAAAGIGGTLLGACNVISQMLKSRIRDWWARAEQTTYRRSQDIPLVGARRLMRAVTKTLLIAGLLSGTFAPLFIGDATESLVGRAMTKTSWVEGGLTHAWVFPEKVVSIQRNGKPVWEIYTSETATTVFEIPEDPSINALLSDLSRFPRKFPFRGNLLRISWEASSDANQAVSGKLARVDVPPARRIAASRVVGHN